MHQEIFHAAAVQKPNQAWASVGRAGFDYRLVAYIASDVELDLDLDVNPGAPVVDDPDGVKVDEFA